MGEVIGEGKNKFNNNWLFEIKVPLEKFIKQWSWVRVNL